MNTTAPTSTLARMGKNRHGKKRNLYSTPRESAEITVSWNGNIQHVVHRELEADGSWAFTIGEEPSCHFIVPTEMLNHETKVPLVELRGAEISVLPLLGSRGKVVAASEKETPFDFVDDISPHDNRSISLARGELLEMCLGCWMFRVRYTDCPRLAPMKTTINWTSSYYLGFSAVLHGVFLLLIALVPPDAAGLTLQADESSNIYLDIFLSAREASSPDITRGTEVGSGGDVAGGNGKRANQLEGQAGSRDARRTNRRRGTKKLPSVAELTRAKNAVKERNQNQLGILSHLSHDGLFSSSLKQQLASGPDPENLIGALRGDKIGANYGNGGLGVVGVGRGGGGDATLNIGMDWREHFSGARSSGRGGIDSGMGPGTRLRSRSNRSEVRVRMGAVVKGSIPKGVIRRIVRGHKQQIRFCYEQGLRRRPDLSGRVAVRFVISGRGVVINSTVLDTSLGDPGVEKCITDAVRRFVFPKPEDGGVVLVTYPFSLTATES